MIAPAADIPAAAEKKRWPRRVGIEVARELCARLSPVCERIVVAGSLRRRKSDVGDVELLFIGKRGMITPEGEIFSRPGDLAEAAIAALLEEGVLEKRPSRIGGHVWGEKNKLAVHRASGMPVDLFTATEENWWNYLVCRTGPSDSNTRIAMAAQERGWKWNPYGAGFSRGGPLAGEPEERAMASEEDVFAFVGLPYLKPEERR